MITMNVVGPIVAGLVLIAFRRRLGRSAANAWKNWLPFSPWLPFNPAHHSLLVRLTLGNTSQWERAAYVDPDYWAELYLVFGILFLAFGLLGAWG